MSSDVDALMSAVVEQTVRADEAEARAQELERERDELVERCGNISDDATVELKQVLGDRDRLARECEALKAALDVLCDAGEQAADFIDEYVDVVDGDYGIPRPNRAMQVHTRLEDALQHAERAVAPPAAGDKA